MSSDASGGGGEGHTWAREQWGWDPLRLQASRVAAPAPSAPRGERAREAPVCV